MKPSLSGRADLIRALDRSDPQLSAATAELLGYAPADRDELIQRTREQRGPTQDKADEPSELDELASTIYEPVDVPFWRLETCEAVARIEPPPQRSTRQKTDPSWRNRPKASPGFLPLAPKRSVLTRLRKVSAMRRTTNDIDVDAVVKRLSQGELLNEVPHFQQRAWGSEITIVEDRARRLVPYWLDQEYIADALRSLYPPTAVTIARLGEGDTQPFIRRPHEQYGQPVAPLPGSLLVVLGDLGCLDRQDDKLSRWWLQWGRQLGEQEVVAIAIVPMRMADISPDLARTWTLVRWDNASTTGRENARQSSTSTVERLLTLLSPAVRVEPGLLRAVRQLLPEGRSDPGLESRVWQDTAMTSRHSVAATMDPERRTDYQQRFKQQPESLQGEVIDLIKTWRAKLHAAVWFEEIIGLDPHLVDVDDLEDAKDFLAAFANEAEQTRDLRDDVAAWINRIAERLPEEACRDLYVQDLLHKLYEKARPRDAEMTVPRWVKPAALPSAGQIIRQAELWQVTDQLRIRSVTDETQPPEHGSPLGLVHTANSQVSVAVGEPEQEKTAFWQTGEPPTWAHDYGWDEYGPWATFRVDEVEQKMRWIPAGSFVMGSPEDEEERFGDEGPQHEVQLTHGFWLFDTPCTQALWQAVTGENPSGFKGAQRPVERVSWRDCQEFIAKLNELLPGLALSLPTEAQWEYACRARTKTARYAEDLDAIAWYDENSDGETHPVKQKRPNAWGLYDMLGNVLEWCYDGQREYTAERVIDPLGPLNPGADRVFRGGDWDGYAQVVRAADRGWPPPDYRLNALGFRCASSSQSQPVLRRPMWSESERQAEPAQTATQRPKPRLLDLNKQSQFSVDIPDANILCFNTDRDGLRFVQMTKPEWADEIGRDKYGLWVIFKVDEVRQTMRWIPPGRFWMGSPENDEEAYEGERPQHEVLLTHGFWLFDTPCTQTLWQAVMGRNPSRFEGEQRPVESVSWEECQEFMQKLNAKVEGLELSFPTEAEWEYACRAGTETPRYAKDLDAIAWYGENSGGKTHPVKQKRPNAWGLYDMLGNVEEWCHDKERKYTAERMVDPVGSLEPEADRVIRGGYWLDDARRVRAALRYWNPPVVRDDDLGFRCASSGQASRLGNRGETDSGVSSAGSETAPTDAGR